MHRLASGFTLVELLVVVAVLALAASAAIPMLHSSLAEADVTAATDEIVAALDHARRASLRSERACRVIFDVTADTMAVQQPGVPEALLDTAATTVPVSETVFGAQETMPHPLKPGFTYRVDFAGERRFGGVAITVADFGGQPWVSFDGSGVPSSAGSVSVARDGARAVVTVAATGSVEVSP